MSEPSELFVAELAAHQLSEAGRHIERAEELLCSLNACERSLLGVVVMVVGVILTDTGSNKVSIRGMRLIREDLSDIEKARNKKNRK